jgi:hypothetical protein
MAGVQLTMEGVTRVSHGRSIRPVDVASGGAAPAADDFIRVLGPDGALLAVAQPAPDGTLHPTLVLV